MSFPRRREDLKTVLIEAGAGDRPLVFLFSDTQIAKEGFVEDINNMLNAGEVRSPRFEVLRCLHAVEATRVHLTRSWVVLFSILSAFRGRSRLDTYHTQEPPIRGRVVGILRARDAWTCLLYTSPSPRDRG